MIKNIIVGGNGAIGSELHRFLIGSGEESFVFGKRGSEQDVSNCLIPTSGFDIIYFLAWDMGGSKYLGSKGNHSSQIENNIKILSNAVPQLIDSNKQIVFISTFAADNIDTPYGITKKIAEMWMSNANCRIIRLGHTYGKVKENNIKSDVVSDFISQAVSNKEIRMRTDGEEKRQFIHYNDAVLIIKKASLEPGGAIYDTHSNFEWVPVMRVAEIIANHTGAKIIKGKEKGIDRDPKRNIPIKNLNPITSLENGIIETIKSFKQ